MRILIVEDDRQMAEYIKAGLKQEGHVVDCVSNGRDGMLQAVTEGYDVLVADRMLPDLDGLNMVKALRAAGIRTPALFLTAMGGVSDRVDGLEAGGDDYLVKPFSFSELLARINALARRPPLTAETTTLKVSDLTMDLMRRRVTRAGRAIDLQPREFRLLEFLMRHTSRVVTRTMLLEHVWDFHFEPHTNVVETHISRLRTKIDKPFVTALIHTVRGAGYSLHDPD